MTINQGYMVERFRDKRNLRKWKLAVLVLVIILAIIVGKKGGSFISGEGAAKHSKTGYIARVAVQGIIMEDQKRERRLVEVAEDDDIKAVIVRMNSPGGSVVGSESLYNSLKKIAKNKPVVMVMESLATSGGYMASLGADYVVAHNGTITGSIGVIFQSAEVTELAEKLGVKFNNFKSGELKAVPNPVEKVTPEAREALMSTIYDVYDYFTALVAQRRKLPLDQVKRLADGRIYSARKALELKLIDEIGDEDNALKWLKEKKKLNPELEVEDFELIPKKKLYDIFDAWSDEFDNLINGLGARKMHGLTSIAS